MKDFLKCIIAVVLLFSATLNANAQFDYNRVTKRFHMGIRGGLSVNSYRGDGAKKLSQLSDFTGGLAFDWQIGSDPLFIGLGINYLNEGYKYYESNRWDNSAIHVPLVFGYHFNVAPNLFVSPYLGGFAAYSVEQLDKDDYDYNRYNFGVRIGCGMNYGRITLDLAYDLGLSSSHVFRNSRDTACSGTFFATIGFNIVGSR